MGNVLAMLMEQTSNLRDASVLPSPTGQGSSANLESHFARRQGKVCSHFLMNKNSSYMTLQPERQKAPLILKVQKSARPDDIEIVSLTDVPSLQVKEGTKTNLDSHGTGLLTLATLESEQ